MIINAVLFEYVVTGVFTIVTFSRKWILLSIFSRTWSSEFKIWIVGDYNYANQKYDSDVTYQIFKSNEIKFNADKKIELF